MLKINQERACQQAIFKLSSQQLIEPTTKLPMRNYSNEDNNLTERDLDLFDLEKAGYWKSEHSGIWYEKAFKKAYRSYKAGELKIYNWVPVGDEKAIECLEEGMVPSFAAVEEMGNE